MDKTDGFIESGNRKEFLFTYSEEEKLQNEINATNAKLIFSPEFIPYYPVIQKKFNLSQTETLLYGFIRFYIGSVKNRFYFTNDQLAEIISSSSDSISRAISNLKEKNVLDVSYKIKSNGGKIRFINGIYTGSDSAKTPIQKPQKHGNNNNKINDNKLNDNKKKYSEAVFLTEAEHTLLLELYGQNTVSRQIEALNNYIMSKGKKYRSHYHTILAWAKRENTPKLSTVTKRKEIDNTGALKDFSKIKDIIKTEKIVE